MDKNLALDLVRVTEIAAVRSTDFIGKGDKNAADQAAVDGMKKMFNNINVDGEIVIGEGEMDEAPMLYIGEKVGNVSPGCEKIDIAVDPIEGTNNVAYGKSNAIAVIAATPKGKMLHAPDMYMDKIAVGPKGKGVISLDKPLEENIISLAKALNKDVSEVTVVMLERERHQHYVDVCRKLGCRTRFETDNDVSIAMSTCFDNSDADLFVGRGGAPEGVLAAAAIKCMDGDFQGRLFPEEDSQIERCKKMGIDVNKLLEIDDLVSGNEVAFAATAITDNDFFKGVKTEKPGIVTTESISMRLETKTIRYIKATHNLKEKAKYLD